MWSRFAFASFSARPRKLHDVTGPALVWPRSPVGIAQTCQPPKRANLETLQKAQKNLEIGTSNLEISKICVK